MNNADIALKFAQSKGFDSVDFQQSWNGFDVFIAQPSGDILTMGYPFFILVNNSIARENDPSELMQLMNFTEVPSDFTEELI